MRSKMTALGWINLSTPRILLKLWEPNKLVSSHSFRMFPLWLHYFHIWIVPAWVSGSFAIHEMRNDWSYTKEAESESATSSPNITWNPSISAKANDMHETFKPRQPSRSSTDLRATIEPDTPRPTMLRHITWRISTRMKASKAFKNQNHRTCGRKGYG
jgi:hypothetical protein